jgi:hypothetical protein
MMKRLIYLTVALMIGFICFGCSGMTAEQRKEKEELHKSFDHVGRSTFVGETSSDAYSLAGHQILGR